MEETILFFKRKEIWIIICFLLLMGCQNQAKQNGASTFEPIVLEAESAKLSNLEIVKDFQGKAVEGTEASGDAFVGLFDNTDGKPSTLTFEVTIPTAGSYELIFQSASPFGDKLNKVSINGVDKGDLLSTQNGLSFKPTKVFAELESGKNIIEISESWGWIYVDNMTVQKAEKASTDLYEVTPTLINSQSTDRTKSLMKLLTDNYGKKVFTGQYGKGIDSNEFKAVHEVTGLYPAIAGFDFIEYSPTRVAHGAVGTDTEKAIEWDAQGGIVTFCWHWNAPKDLIDSNDIPWWKGFYTEGTTFNFADALDGKDPEGYKLLLSDIDAIAAQIKILQDQNIPVLWRPLHEASGGWFWWGTQGSESYKKLWQLIYDRLTNVHHLNNLIWVWNGQNKDWYPGDDYVDIISEDIYATKHNYDAQKEKFLQAAAYTPTKKLVALSETGVIPDLDKMFENNICWSFFATWSGEFTIQGTTSNYSSDYTEAEQLNKTYHHPNAITLEEVPKF